MYFFATGHVIHPDRIGPHLEEETAALDALRAEGVVRAAFRRANGPGVIGIFEGESLEFVQAKVERLPFVTLGLMTFDYDEIVEL